MAIQYGVLGETAPQAATPPLILRTRVGLPIACESLQIQSGHYCARLLATGNENDVGAYETHRFECFVQRKGWVTADPANPGRETDGYDPFCHHLGVFRGPDLVAYVRILPWQSRPGFMLQNEFRDLIPEELMSEIAHDGHVELSRFLVHPPAGSPRTETLVISELLFKLVYGLCKHEEWTNLYIVLEQAWLRILNSRFNVPFAQVGASHTYPDGTKTMAASVSRDLLEESMFATSIEKYHWYRAGIV